MDTRPDFAVLDALPFGAIVLDSAGFVCYANSRVGEMAACEPQSLLGDSVRDLEPLLRGLDMRHIEGLLETQTVTERRPAGIEIGTAEPARRAWLHASRLHVSGTARPHVLLTVEPVPDASSLARDLARLEHKVLQARDLKHEMVNVLMAIMGHAELLFDQGQLDPSSQAKVEQIQIEGRRLKDHLASLSEICSDSL